MPVTKDGEVYLNTREACDYLGVSRETLRRYVFRRGLKQYHQGITRVTFYKQEDLDRLLAFREGPAEDNED